ITILEHALEYRLVLESGEVVLTPEDVTIASEDMPGWLVAVEGNLTIALDITVSDGLRREGTARELVNRIQNLRKEYGFEVSDKIRIAVAPAADVLEALDECKEYVCAQTLAVSLTVTENVLHDRTVEWGEGTLGISLTKV
ncbi:MAG: DUF5915 domain-containing protein, partial [Bacteroidetes bacterium]|nr:DUF5915 domain-containing protein [Bacteroidota bacterium]